MTRRRSGRRPGQAGFTMIEVMLAVLLTAIATSGIIGLYMVETRASGFSKHTTEATVLAQDEMEKLRTNGVSATGFETNIDQNGAPGGIFRRDWNIVPGASYTDITVTVSWTEDGVSRSVSVIGRRGS